MIKTVSQTENCPREIGAQLPVIEGNDYEMRQTSLVILFTVFVLDHAQNTTVVYF